MSLLFRHQTAETRGGFTLVELLVVIGIVGLLLALAVPVLSRGVKTAHETQCVSNLRHIGAANLAFAADNDGEIAAGGHWSNYWSLYQIREYLEGSSELDNFLEVLVCPTDTFKGWGNPAVGYQILRRSYGVNNFLRQGDNGKRLARIASPAKTVYAGDTGLSPTDSSWIGGSDPWISSVTLARHGGRINYVFLDGHVAGFETSSLYLGGDNHGIFTGE